MIDGLIHTVDHTYNDLRHHCPWFGMDSDLECEFGGILYQNLI